MLFLDSAESPVNRYMSRIGKLADSGCKADTAFLSPTSPRQLFGGK